ncbi:matrixin family metalloprotease [Roseovarius aestuarii]|uniref:RTX-I toxin determinant A from serotypes 1/9 n=1 Tax=Roseovarius aestuarii TaxID=475083 RepID=A0A1X7BKQ1_9RHOB|nr:matrixin family metalloprotease [Roseovarius aestuarii]SMC10238.1 RTX-I toxin determinant A from serotypes 1/9 [Roseovarius aestuarii]
MANIFGTKWGSSTLGTPGGTVTWSIAGAGLDISRFGINTLQSVSGNSFLNYNFVNVIADAFAEWSTYGDIEFQQVADGGGAAGVGLDADIRIFFGAIPGSTAGYAFYPSSHGSAIAGDILLDTLTVFNTNQTLFRSIVLHEVGHALGLGHVDDNSILTPTISETTLQPDDIAGIQAIYGVQDNVPPNNNNSIDQTLVGTGGRDTIKGNDGDDTIDGGGARDTLYGGDDDDIVDGGTGNDLLFGNSGNDSLLGENGKDILKGGSGDDTLEGGAGDDVLKGGRDSDVLISGDGNDILWGGKNADQFVFGDNHGVDRIFDFAAKNSLEKIDLSGVTGFDSFSDVRAAATKKNGHVLIDTGPGSLIVIKDTPLWQLDASDFLF